jgi:hypothetical protein
MSLCWVSLGHLTVANTLTYADMKLVTAVKSFTIQAPNFYRQAQNTLLKSFQISVTANRNPMYSIFAHVNTSLRTYCSNLIYISNEKTNREDEETDENRDRQKKYRELCQKS